MANRANRNLWIDYLRSAITVLVVAHHSSHAYTTFATFDKKAYINSTHAIVDIKRWIGMDLFQNFNDIFFMSLMFLIGGLFLIKSINKKGETNFIKDRFYRLFIPFLLLGTLFMLIAYFPSYYVAHNNVDIIAYVNDFFWVEKWPVGPPWFIWVLFLFNLLFALFHKIGEKIGISFSIAGNKPFTFFIILFLVSFLLYVPMAYNFGAGAWVGVGPFDFQLSRILLYLGYFVLGIFIGKTDFNKNIFSTESRIVKMWWFWLLLSLVIYFMLTIMSDQLTQFVKDNKIREFNAWMIYYTIYVLSCTISCIAFITGFRKLIIAEKFWWSSLSENAYLIYLIHYIFVIWCQFLLMKFNIPALVKFLITFTLALSLSWVCSNMLRKIRVVNKYL